MEMEVEVEIEKEKPRPFEKGHYTIPIVKKQSWNTTYCSISSGSSSNITRRTLFFFFSLFSTMKQSEYSEYTGQRLGFVPSREGHLPIF